MAEFRRDFTKGRQNLDADNRLLPPGEYREALNVEVDTRRGVVLKALSNKRLTNLSFGPNPRCLGMYEDEFRKKIYVLVLSDTGSFLYEYDVATQVSTFVLQDTRVLGERVFDLREEYPCTAMSKIISDDINKELLLMTDDFMQPLCINIERAKGYAVNGFDKEDIYLIKKPPRFAPTAQLTYAGGFENTLKENFFTFAYRFKYQDGEYSALSDFTQYMFAPGTFQLDPQTGENLGMVNQFNAVRIGFNTGDKRVTDIQLVFKKSNSNNLYIIETFNKAKEGWDNSDTQYFTFTNNKLYQVLPQKELYRLFDNVPLKAKAMSILGNKPFFGNYVEGYNMLDVNGNKIKPEYHLSIISNGFTGEEITVLLPASGDTNGDVIFRSDFTGITLKQGGRITFSVGMQSVDESAAISGSYVNNFEYILLQDYANAEELAQDENFINFVNNVMTTSFLNNYVFTPPADTTLESTTDFTIAYTTNTIDIIGPDQTWRTDNTPGDPEDEDFTDEVYQWRFFTAGATYREFGVASSLKTNRSYEVGIVYEDEFNRCSTVQTCNSNTIYIPQSLSTSQNKIKVSLESLPPTWADRYKLVVKQPPLSYNNIYAVMVYEEGLFYWVKLEGANKDKVQEGDVLILKADANGARSDIYEVMVIEIRDQEKDFIPENTSATGVPITEPAGKYMKIKKGNFAFEDNANTFIVYGWSVSSDPYIPLPPPPQLYTESFGGYLDADSGDYIDYPITAGAIIGIDIRQHNHFNGYNPEYYDQITVSGNYDRIEDWYEAEFSWGEYADNFSFTFERDENNKLAIRVNFLQHYVGSSQLAYMSIQYSSTSLIFETEPKTADVEIFFESQTLPITDGYHEGTEQDQTSSLPAVIEMDFFNCFVMGNGAECYQVKDSLTKPYLNIDLRPSATSIEEYKQIRRIADITYGEAYIESASINGINVFNLSTGNIKDDIDKQHGSIQKLYARENNLVVLQEDKSGYVLYDKNAIYTADGNSTLTSIPGVLGQYIPYQGKRGIGKNPESFSVDHDGRIKYWSQRAGSPVRLSLDGVEEINYGLEDTFKELSLTRPNAMVLSGYDPYKNQTVFTFGDEPEQLPLFTCGSIINRFNQDTAFSYEFQLNNLGGDIVFSYNITSGNATITAEFNGNTEVVSNTTGAGTITMERDSLVENRVTVTITPVGGAISYTVTNTCPVGTELTIVSLVLNDEADEETTMTDRYKWGSTSYYSVDELFNEGPVTRFSTQTGIEGQGAFPSNGSLVTLQAFKDTINSGHFATTECNRLGYLITSTVYTSADYDTILNHADTVFLTITTVDNEGISQTDTASFLFERTGEDEILYLIWDYTSRNPVISNDTASVSVGESVIIDVLANDDVSTEAVVTVATQPVYGTAVANVDGTITYTHDGTEHFADSFTYTVTDGGCSSTATVALTIGVACGDTLSASGASGIYEVVLNFGTNTGYCGIQYNALSIPDRFELIWNGVTVADSKYVGDNIDPGPPTSYTGLLGEHTLPVFEYTGGAFVDTGDDETFTVIQSDIADNETEPTDGNGFLLFNKTTALPTTVTLRATGPVGGTSWSLTSIVCPSTDIANATEMLVYGLYAEADKGLATKSIKVYKDNTLNKFYTNILGDTAFGMYGTNRFFNDGTNWWEISSTGNIIDTGTLP